VHSRGPSVPQVKVTPALWLETTNGYGPQSKVIKPHDVVTVVQSMLGDATRRVPITPIALPPNFENLIARASPAGVETPHVPSIDQLRVLFTAVPAYRVGVHRQTLSITCVTPKVPRPMCLAVKVLIHKFVPIEFQSLPSLGGGTMRGPMIVISHSGLRLICLACKVLIHKFVRPRFPSVEVPIHKFVRPRFPSLGRVTVKVPIHKFVRTRFPSLGRVTVKVPIHKFVRPKCPSLGSVPVEGQLHLLRCLK
jgi:hypothetical protein